MQERQRRFLSFREGAHLRHRSSPPSTRSGQSYNHGARRVWSRPRAVDSGQGVRQIGGVIIIGGFHPTPIHYIDALTFITFRGSWPTLRPSPQSASSSPSRLA